MTDQEIEAVLTAQAHIRARKRAMIHMALGEMKSALDRGGVSIRPDVWAGYCRQSLAVLLQQDCAEDRKSRVATIAKVLAENPQYRRSCARESSGQRPGQTWLQPSDTSGNTARRRPGLLRYRLILRCTDGREFPELEVSGSR